MPCITCSSSNTVRDDISGDLVCGECGTLQPYDNYDAQLGGLQGPQGTNIRIGTKGIGSVLVYKDKKIYEANNLIDDILLNLELNNGSKASTIRDMVEKVTDGEFGQGDWFPVLVGACCYIVMREDNRLLPMSEIATVVNCDERELGSMITRVVKFLGLSLPVFDVVELFERVISNSPSIRRLEREKVVRIKEQGIFLMNCAVKWFLSTGRKPLPLVAAVLVVVAELNEFTLAVEEVAKELQVPVSTCRTRHKELLEKLVQVGRESLVWGKDITKKNIMKHASSVISCMEAKSMKTPGRKGIELERDPVDLGDVISDCLRKDDRNFYDDDYGDDNVVRDSPYFEVTKKGEDASSGDNDVDWLKFSHESLSMIYMNFANAVDSGSLTGESTGVKERRKGGGLQFALCRDWWNGKSELSKKLLLKKVLEKDIGPEGIPPSYIKGGKAVERRKERIKAAKIRINKIMHPSNTDSDPVDHVTTGMKRKRKQAADIDWEDLIIETLLLHRVKEEAIESGHYNTLMDLHVFSSGIV